MPRGAKIGSIIAGGAAGGAVGGIPGGVIGATSPYWGRPVLTGASRLGASPWTRQAGETLTSLGLSQITRPIRTKEEIEKKEQRERESKWGVGGSLPPATVPPL